jgi:hypothetical protein
MEICFTESHQIAQEMRKAWPSQAGFWKISLTVQNIVKNYSSSLERTGLYSYLQTDGSIIIPTPNNSLPILKGYMQGRQGT